MQQSWIETFLAIVDTRNITDASSKLYLSQSTVSTRLIQLEDYLGYKLFERGKGLNQIDLTESGEAFLPLAKEFIELTDIMKKGKFPSRSGLHLKIAATNSIIESIIYKYINYIQAKTQRFYFETRTRHSVELYDDVNEDKVDFGLSLKEFKYSGLETIEILSIPFYIYSLTGVEKEEFKFKNITLEDYIHIPWGFEVENFLNDRFTNKQVYTRYTDSVITAFLTLSKNQWLLAPATYKDIIPRGIDIDYFREDEFPFYKVYLIYKTTNYQNNEVFKVAADSITKFFKHHE